MKKTAGVIFILLLLLFFTPHTSWADVNTVELQKTLHTSVDYTLPYPGLLPDNPLYFIKTVRDKLVSFFITDPQKQAKFDLLQADKRLAAGEYLLQEPHPNAQLISQTVSKGENYFDDAITNIALAQKQGILTNDFLDKLTKAGIKHQQVLYSMQQQTKGELHDDLGQNIERVQNFEKEVMQLEANK